MDPSSIIVQCDQGSSWVYKIIWGALVPLFLCYVAAAAYTFQRRRSDIETINAAIKDMRALTNLALTRMSGQSVNLETVQESAMALISRVRLEMLHRPEYIQSMIHEALTSFLDNADVADGTKQSTPNEILERQRSAEEQLINLARQLTVIEALRQAWSNPGLKVSFDNLFERFSGTSESESEKK